MKEFFCKDKEVHKLSQRRPTKYISRAWELCRKKN